MTVNDLGTVLSQTGAALKATYATAGAAGSTFQAGRASTLTLFADATFDAATTLADIKFQVQARYDNGTTQSGWVNIGAETTLTASAGKTVSAVLQLTQVLATGDLQVLAHYDTGTPAAGDSLKVYALAAAE